MRWLAWILLFIPSILPAQIILTWEGLNFIDTVCTNVNGISVPRTQPTTFTFRNNYVQSCNTNGYMLQAGHEAPSVTLDHKLDGEQILGNKFAWRGDQDATTITHGIFTGYHTGVKIMYNYLDYVPMGIIRKSNGMTDTTGVVAYNIIRNSPAVGIVVKGMNGVRIYNNTLYSEDSVYVSGGIGTWRGLIDVYKNDNPVADAKGVKIKNNIFYTVNRIININVMDTACLQGFESDYNIFWCEAGEPLFRIGGVQLTLTQWRERGYDLHSQVMDPYFINTRDLVPSFRMQWGTPTEFDTGLAANARWVTGEDPALVRQNGQYWQQGARIYEGNLVIFYRSAQVIGGDSTVIEMKFGKVTIRQGEITIQ
jgi:hypothetical protein